MIYRTVVMAATLGTLALASCGSDGDGRGVVANDSTAMEAIVGDKSKVAEVMRRSHARGTFDDAVALVLADSAMAYDLFGALRSDPRFSGTTTTSNATPESNTTTGGSKSLKGSTVRTLSQSKTTTTPPKGDVLDQTERTAQKANEKIEQAARIKREAEEAKRKVEDILGRK